LLLSRHSSIGQVTSLLFPFIPAQTQKYRISSRTLFSRITLSHRSAVGSDLMLPWGGHFPPPQDTILSETHLLCKPPAWLVRIIRSPHYPSQRQPTSVR